MEPAGGIRPSTARSQMGGAAILVRLARRGFHSALGAALFLIALRGNIISAANRAEPVRLAMSAEFMGFNYGKEHGLPDDDVRDILQTRDGSLWILTQEGLARFDGVGFTVFDRANSPAFQGDDPRALAEDQRGNLWVGGKDLLLRMAGNTLVRPTVPGSEKIVHAYQLCPDSEGGIWIGGETNVAHLTPTQVRIYGPESGLVAGKSVLALQVDEIGALYVGSYGGCFRFDAQRQRFERVDPEMPAGEKALATLVLHRGRAGNLWRTVAEVNDTRSSYAQEGAVQRWVGGAWKPLFVGDAARFPFGYGLQFALEDRRENLWLSGTENELHRIRGTQVESLSLRLRHRPDIAMCLREDHEGSLWMGTLHSGLWRWQPRRMQSLGSGEGLPHENVWALCEDPDGAVWVGTDGGLARFAGGRWEKWTTEQGLSRNSIRALAVDRAGTVWIGTGEGLNSWRDGELTRHPIPGEWFESKIRAILPTRDGALWVAGAASLNRLNGGERTKFTTAEGLVNNDVRALLEDSRGRLWIGTFGGGLQCLENGGFTTYATTNGLASGFVWALHEDVEGMLWIGTESGLHRLHEGRIVTLGKAQGLPDNLVNFILEDGWGQLWISHDRGIYRVPRAGLNAVADGRTNLVRCVSYTKADGLPSEETNGQKSYPPACKTSDGRLWFATTKGVAVIDPKLHHEETAPPPVAIERFRATGDLVFSRDPQDPLSPERTLTRAESSRPTEPGGGILRLPAGSGRVVEFTFTANTFVSADRVRFKYRLHGLDDRWVEAGTRRQALFTNLRPGAYRFQVSAANHHGVWNETGASCAFQIAPAFHETWWFYALCGGVSAVLGAALVIWRVREQRKIYRLEQQAAVAAERTRIAQDLHDGLGADLTRLGTLADLASDAPEQASRDQLRKLAQSSREATRGLKDLIWMANPANDTLESFLDRLCQNAEDYLRDAQIVCRFDLDPNLPPLPLSLDQRRNLLLVAREAFNNVVKHSGASEVLITARRRAGYLELSMQDNGRGFDHGDIRSGAMGLGGMRRRIESLGGSFQLESSPGNGTRIVIQIKWRPTDHAKPQG